MRVPDKPIVKPDTYFSLWKLTDEGVRSPAGVRDTVGRASAMIRELGGECHLYVSIGGPYDMIGVARGVDDTKIVQVQHAIRSLGALETTFIKTREFSSKDYRAYIRDVNRLRRLKL